MHWIESIVLSSLPATQGAQFQKEYPTKTLHKKTRNFLTKVSNSNLQSL
jgi:hypothetical protein